MRKKIPLIGGIINLIESLKGDIGIIENTDVATHSISAGSYVIWKNELYKASSAIAVDDALSSSNLTAVSGGAANELNNKLSDTGWVELNSKVSYRRIYQTVYVFINVPANFLTHSWQNIGTLPSDCYPSTTLYNMCFRNADGGIWLSLGISNAGAISVMGTSAGGLATQYIFATGL